MWWISLVLMIIAGMFNSCMDVLRYRYSKSIFASWPNQQWVNPSLSQSNKWASNSKFGDLIMSTVLVWMTDLWHFAKTMMLICISFAIVMYQPIVSIPIDALIFYTAFTSTFELFFSTVLVK